MKIRNLFLTVFCLLAVSPSALAKTVQRYDLWNLADLQRWYSKAVVKPLPWVGYWWPYNLNGISSGEFDRKKLSPAEKLDMALGSGDWVSGWEYQNHGQGRSSPDWWGHCNGWATAAVMENEPRGPITVNGVRFDVRDRKALLAEYWMESGSDFIGHRVWSFDDTSSSAFWDVTPAQFHLLMTNIVGKQNRSVIADRYTGAEVWNHPIIAYQIEPIRPEDYLGADPRYRNLYRVDIKATLWWANDEVESDAVTPRFEWKDGEYFTKRRLRYELWVDAPLRFDSRGRLVSSGNIIMTDTGVGGRWKNGTSYATLVESHPDFIWIPITYSRSTGYKNPRLNDAWVHSNIVE